MLRGVGGGLGWARHSISAYLACTDHSVGALALQLGLSEQALEAWRRGIPELRGSAAWVEAREVQGLVTQFLGTYGAALPTAAATACRRSIRCAPTPNGSAKRQPKTACGASS